MEVDAYWHRCMLQATTVLALALLLIPACGDATSEVRALDPADLELPRHRDVAFYTRDPTSDGELARRIALFNPARGEVHGRYRDNIVVNTNRHLGDQQLYDVSWRYMGTVEAGDVWVFQIYVPIAEELDQRTTEAIVYDGGELVLYDDPNLTIVLKQDVSDLVVGSR